MITIVVGKPGAGKSYDTVSRLASDIVDRINRSAEVPTIATNLKLNIDKFKEYIKKETKKEIEIDIILLSEDDLEERRWWRNLPDDSRIILDESQFYWSSKKISDDDQQDLIECLSTHRHRRQDFILLTQSLTSLSVDIRKYAENVIEVLNAKSITIPFPVSIPLRDIQILFRAFGSTRQLYRTREGLLEGTYRVAWEGELLICKTSPKIYHLYRSTDSAKQGDNALPFADGPGMWWRGLKWFFYRHFFHLAVKAIIVIVPLLYLADKYLFKSKISKTDNSTQVDINSTFNNTDNPIDVGIVPRMQGDGWYYDGTQFYDDSSSSARGGGL